MKRSCLRTGLRLGMRTGALAGLLLVSAFLISAQNWKTSDSLPNVDLSGLSPGQKATALHLMREHACGCGCGMKVAECRIADPSCSYSTGLAQVMVDTLRQGKSPAEALAAADNSRYAHVPQPKLLDDAVAIPITGDPFSGNEKARITVVEFSDFQCPYCAQAVPQIEALLKAYPLQMKLVFKQFPLEIHPQADLAAAAAIAAQKQGKFWQMHDALFASHNDLSRKTILALAKQNGLDLNRFEADWDSSSVRETVVRDVQDGDKAGVEGTPTIFINGQKFNGPIQLAVLQPVFEAELKKPTKSGNQTASLQVGTPHR